MRTLLYFFVLLSLTLCCSPSKYDKLQEIDSLISNNVEDSALVLLSLININDLKDSSVRAYYYLLKSQAYYRTNCRENYVSMLDTCINYYERHLDTEKLARAYYYRGASQKYGDNYKDAFYFLKKAESLALKYDYCILQHHIYDMMSYLNERIGHYQLSLAYARKALALSNKLGKEDWLVEDLNSMSAVFSLIGMNDSSDCYTKKTFAFLNTPDTVLRRMLYESIALYYLNNNKKDSAEHYIKKVIDIKKSSWAYCVYGIIKNEQGKHEEAYKLWKNASKTDKLNDRLEALRWMAEYKKEKGLYKDATMLNDTIKMLSDSLKARQRSEEVAQLQSNMDREDDRRMADERLFATIIWAVVIAAVLVAAVVVMKVEMTSAARQIAQGNKKIAEYEKSIDEARKAGRDSEKEVARLQRKIEDLRERQSRILAHGKQLYGEIVHGGNAAKWSRGDFEDCVEYLRTLYPQRLHDIERQYAKLTAHNIFFVVMKDNGFEDDEMAQMLNSSIGAIRTMKSRIHNKKIA